MNDKSEETGGAEGEVPRTDGCPFGDADHERGAHCESCLPCFEPGCGAYATHIALFTAKNPIVAVYACTEHKDGARHEQYDAPLGVFDMRPAVGETWE